MRESSQRIGIKDVAQRAGVSLSSVSRVLDGHADVSAAMRRRVQDAVNELGYVPDPLAQSLRTGTTMTIGFVAGDTGNPLISRIAVAAQLGLRAAGYSLLVANSGNDEAQESTNIQLLKNRKVDGLLLSVADETTEALAGQLSAGHVPVVLVDREPGAFPVGAVQSDHVRGIGLAAEHLIRLGHRRTALIVGHPRVRPSRERVAALRAAFVGVEGSEIAVASGTFSDTHGYDAAMSLLQRATPPTALIAGGNQLLVGVLRAVRDLGLSIPGDLSLITCDTTPLAELYSPEIATISRDASQLGSVAAEMLVELIAGGEPTVRLLPTDFTPGASCAPPLRGGSAA